MTATVTKQTPDRAALATDAERKLQMLLPQRQRLAPAVLAGDKQAAMELADVESEITSAKRLLEWVRLAGDEQAELEREALEAEEQARREQARRRAAKLEARVPASREAIDSAMATLFGAMAADVELSRQIRRELVAAGEDRPRVGLEPREAQSAALFHQGVAGLNNLLDIPRPMRGHPRPLAPPAEK